MHPRYVAHISSRAFSLTDVDGCEPSACVPFPSSYAIQKHTSACTCLQQNAEILSNPSIAEMNACNGTDDPALSLDKVLSLTRQGASVWRNLISCTKCPYDNDQEVVMLAYMGIRAVTRYLQHLGPRYSQRGSDTNDPLPAKETVRLMVGPLEVEGDERVFVFRMLFQKMVQNVQETLHSLERIQETSSRAVGTDDYQLSSSLLHIRQTSHTLTNTLKELESAVKSA